MKQKERIIEYLKKHGSITSMEAMRELGIMRLGARMFEIAEEFPVVRTTEKGKNRFGETTYYKRYSISEASK